MRFPTETIKSWIQARRKDIWVGVCFLIVAALLACVSVWAYREYMTTPPYVDPERYPVRGIDVSAHNGMMNLDAARADGIEFIFIKASEGTTFRDENFRINYSKARHAGMKIGAYHFFRFDCDGVEQAKNFEAAVRGRHLELGLAIDVEEHGNPAGIDSALIARRLREMTDYLNLEGYRVTYYSNRDGYYEHIAGAFPGAQLWICSFNSTPINAEWTFWQYSHHGKVAGIRGDVDLDTFCGSRDEWNDYLRGDIWPYDEMERKIGRQRDAAAQ